MRWGRKAAGLNLLFQKTAELPKDEPRGVLGLSIFIIKDKYPSDSVSIVTDSIVGARIPRLSDLSGVWDAVLLIPAKQDEREAQKFSAFAELSNNIDI